MAPESKEDVLALYHGDEFAHRPASIFGASGIYVGAAAERVRYGPMRSDAAAAFAQALGAYVARWDPVQIAPLRANLRRALQRGRLL